MFEPIFAVILVVLVALPLSARRRGLHAVLAVAALAWIIVAALGALTPDALASLFFPAENRAYHDTYYVVSHTQLQLSNAALLGLLALGAWIARPLPLLAALAFWVMHVAAALSVLPGQFIGTPDPSDDIFALAQKLEVINQVSLVASIAWLAATLVLCVLVALGLVRRFRARA